MGISILNTHSGKEPSKGPERRRVSLKERKKSIVLCSYREKLELDGLMKGRWDRKVKEGKWRGTTNTEGPLKNYMDSDYP